MPEVGRSAITTMPDEANPRFLYFPAAPLEPLVPLHPPAVEEDERNGWKIPEREEDNGATGRDRTGRGVGGVPFSW